ncbi:nuclear transport factor 2 family protein [Lampropedia puyangensis]|uniref:Nuclear transport factor 2 family protein n=1 Tax=Lampropedia puyangensis TaxID=1330072 RepID=A0A4V4GS60_9BURK|nr:nuclear transport factor 2 family protein [Lampropedia puyangensis]THU04036.1 nuclear transport factor 2 family protein [Lampropedia puyangensis]
MTNTPSNLAIIQATYEGTSEENGKNLLAVLAPEARWTEAAGFPYAGTYVGPEQIVAGVFQRLGTEWDGYNAKVHTYLADGDRVAAFGVYSGTYRKTGKHMSATFAHLYHLKDGKILSMEQYVDSHMVQQALTAQ